MESEVYLRFKRRNPPVGEPPLCACGCGERTAWQPVARKWSRLRSGHNGHLVNGNGRSNLVEPDLSRPVWCYLLGAHLGDGCDSHRLDIAVGKDEPGWADKLVGIMRFVGLEPGVTKTLRVRASGPLVMREFAKWKPGGRDGLWEFPSHLAHWKHVLAGLVDSDGGLARGDTWNVFQRDNGNIERLDAWLKAQGETRLHVGHDKRTGHARLRGRDIPLKDQARLGIRGMLRDELAPFLQNPNRIELWAAYRAAHKPRVSSRLGAGESPDDASRSGR